MKTSFDHGQLSLKCAQFLVYLCVSNSKLLCEKPFSVRGDDDLLNSRQTRKLFKMSPFY